MELSVVTLCPKAGIELMAGGIPKSPKDIPLKEVGRWKEMGHVTGPWRGSRFSDLDPATFGFVELVAPGVRLEVAISEHPPHAFREGIEVAMTRECRVM
jgi:hypothetical protein